MDKTTIVITHCSLDNNVEEIWKMGQNDEKLIYAIKEVREQKALNGIETFEQRQNIIATEEGYYFAFWEEDLINN
jgi:hypothetical protein